MLKKLLLALCLIATGVKSAALSEKSTLSAKTGYMMFADNVFGQIYNAGGPLLQLSYTYKINTRASFYSSIGYFQKSGTTLSIGDKTTLSKVPVDLGITWAILPDKNISLDMTMGARLSLVSQHNETPSIDANIATQGLGGFALFQACKLLKNGLNIGVFGEFSYEPICYNKQLSDGYIPPKRSVGGITLGLSVSKNF